MGVDALGTILRQTLPQASWTAHANVAAALQAARAAAKAGDCILAFGSFFVATAVLAEHAAMAGGVDAG
jgi:dihydrofolate synthase/folylpolyglutamate synthase